MSNTWASFSGPANVCAWDETGKDYTRALHYYQDEWGLNNTSAAALLKDGDGQCHSWADLFKESLLVNNVANVKRTLVEPDTGYEWFGVKNIGFDDCDPDYPNDAPWKYSWNDLDTAVSGIPGQNMATPSAKRFNLHWIVHRTGDATYHDPSYGTTATGNDDFTNNAIAAWGDTIAGILHWRRVGSDPAVDPVYVVLTDYSW